MGIPTIIGPIAACSSPPAIVQEVPISVPSPQKVVPTLEIAPSGIKTSIWKKTDLAISKYAESGKIREGLRTFNIKPPFYDGPEPLKISMKAFPSPGPYSVDTILTNEFDTFTNFFVYENLFTIRGAQTYDKNGNLLAESRLEYPPPEIINTKEAHFYLHEVHYYKNGNVIFGAKSELDRSGIKIREVTAEGKKEKEYYFFFPLH